MPTETHPSICRFCHANCGILVEVEDGVPVRVTGDPENPAYFGFTCAKGRSLPEQHAHPDRLLHSQKRQADGSYRSISAETAMDEVLAKFMRDGVDSDALARIKMQVHAAQIYAQDDVEGLAKAMAETLDKPLPAAQLQAAVSDYSVAASTRGYLDALGLGAAN